MNDKIDNDEPVEAEPLEIPAGAKGLARLIAKCGYASRRQAEEIVRSGRVNVDGRRVSDPQMMVLPQSEIVIDGTVLQDVLRTYFAFHKPLDVVTSATVNQRVNLVSSFLPNDIPGLQAAGRLDAGTSGLLLISNDNSWNALAASGHGLEKEFLITVQGHVDESHVGMLTAGITIASIGTFQAQSCSIMEIGRDEAVIRLAMKEGKLRQIKVLLSALHLKVVGMHRIRIGPVKLGVLPEGRLRQLSTDEVNAILQGAAGKTD